MKKILSIVFSLMCLLTFSQQITQAEYFFDTDPGYGNATAITIDNGDEIEINEWLNTSNLTSGFHSVCIRVKDEAGNWSPLLSKAFFIQENFSQAIPIDHIEYFYDEDPGYGSGWQYTEFSPSTHLEEIFFSNVDGLDAGMHEVYIRLRDELGKWSQTYSQQFELINCDLYLSGMLMHPDQSVVDDAEIILYQYFGEGSAVGIDTVQLIEGSYSFGNVCPMSQYLLKVIPQFTNDFLPTYYGNTSYWEEATIITTSQSSQSNMDIVVVDFADLEEGSSLLGGHIYYANSKGEPVKNVDVILEYDSPDEKAGFEAVAYDRSNDTGEWTIENLPVGSFRIQVEIPGLEMDTTYYVNISSEQTNINNLDFFVDLNTGIFIEHFGIEEIYTTENINVYPNPAVNQDVWIQNDQSNMVIEEISVYNYSGKFKLVKPENQSVTHLNTSSWVKGFYLIKIKTNKGLFTKKLIVQ